MSTSIISTMKTIQRKPLFKQSVLFFLLIQASFGSTYTLNTILSTIEKDGSLSKVLQQEGLALEAKNQADTLSDPLELFVEGTRANPIVGKSGNEYAVGVAKQIKFGSIQEEEQMITRLSNQAYLLEEEKNILNFRNSIKNNYHQHCLDKQKYKSFVKNYQNFETLYKLSLIHISEPTRQLASSRMPSSA